MFGEKAVICVSESELAIIHSILQKNAADCEVRAFGSRYAWTSRDSSDLDLAFVGSAKLGVSRLGILREAFEESSLPFRVDVLDWHTMTKEFQAIISKGYEVIYSPKKNKKENWQKVRLGDVVTTNASLYTEKENRSFVNYLDTGNISENRIEQIQTIDMQSEKLPSRARRKVNVNDIVYSTVRPIQRHYGILKNIPENFLVSTGFTTISPTDYVDSAFIYYFLTQNEIVTYLQTLAEQTVSTYPSIKPSDIEDLQINLPPHSTQRAIAATLSCLDDKIELNYRINANLEAQAQAIFKSWFVDFEPFKNGGFVDSELGSMPKGWRVDSFTSIVDVLSGGTPKTDNHAFWNGHIPFFTPKDIDGTFVIATEKYITDEGLNNCNSKLYPVSTIFITARGTVGKIVFTGCDMAMSQTSYALVGRDDYNQYYIYGLVQEIVKRLKHKAIGAVFSAIVTRDFDSELIVVPPSEIAQEYRSIVEPLYSQMLNLTNESRALAAIRDALLPRLMSGEIAVEEASK